jgi:plastocyanin domain-containing protein
MFEQQQQFHQQFHQQFQQPILVVNMMPVTCIKCTKTVYHFIKSAEEHQELNTTYQCIPCTENIGMIPEEIVQQESEDSNLLSTEGEVILEHNQTA